MNIKGMPIVFAVSGVVGTSLAVYLTYRSTEKATRAVVKKEAELGRDLTRGEKFDVSKRYFVAPVAATAATIGTAVAAGINGQNTENIAEKAITTSNIFKKAYTRLRNSVNETLDDEKKNEIKKNEVKKEDEQTKTEVASPVSSSQLYFDDFAGYYWAEPEYMFRAQYDINRSFVMNNPMSLGEFYEMANVKFENKKLKYSDFDYIGWSIDQFDKRGYSEYSGYFIDFDEVTEQKDETGRSYTYVTMLAPTEDYFDPYLGGPRE